MDAIDFGLCMCLVVNSRVAYKELAEIFKMSVNSIHKRIKSLVDIEVLQNFNTKLSLTNFPNSISVVMFGDSSLEYSEDLLDKIGNNESIFNVTRAGGNFYYIHAHLRVYNELDPLVSFIRNEGGINEIEIGLISTKHTTNAPTTSDQSLKVNNVDTRYSDLDYLIIDTLKDNSRKPVTEIADKVGVTPKTVRRRLTKLIENELLDFSIEWYPDKSSIILSIVIMKLDPTDDVDKLKLLDELKGEFGQTILFSWNFSNLPNLMIICIWIQSMKELQDIENSLKAKVFTSVKATVLVKGKMYPSWRDTYLQEQIKEIKSK